MKKSCLLLVIACAGCGSPAGSVDRAPQIQFKGRSEDFAEARFAAEEWNRVCGTNISFAPHGIPMMETSSIEPSGATTIFQTTVLKIEYRPDAPRRWTFVHEFGHLLLIPHQTEGVMTASETAEDGVTDEDCSHIGEGF